MLVERVQQFYITMYISLFIGVGAQSTLGGMTFLPEMYVWKINKMPEF